MGDGAMPLLGAVVLLLLLSSLLFPSSASAFKLPVSAGTLFGDVGLFLLSAMLLALLLVVISDPFCSEMRFSLDKFRCSDSLRLPFDGLCSMLLRVDERDGPGGVAAVSVPVPLAVAGCSGFDHCVVREI